MLLRPLVEEAWLLEQTPQDTPKFHRKATHCRKIGTIAFECIDLFGLPCRQQGPWLYTKRRGNQRRGRLQNGKYGGRGHLVGRHNGSD